VVRAEAADITEVKLSLYIGRAVAQAVSGQPVTARARVRSQISPSEICAAQSSTGTVSLVSPVSSIPPILHTHLHRQLLLPEKQMVQAWEPSKMLGSCEKWGALDRRKLPRFSVFIRWNNEAVSLTSFRMAKGRTDASQHLVLSDWHVCGEEKCVQDFGVFT